jgi:hypothetical protein
MEVGVAAADKGLFERLYAAAGERLGQRLFDELRTSGALRPRWTLARVGAYAIATLVHGITIALVLAAIAAILLIHTLFGWILAAFLLALAWVLRPRYDTVQTESVDRADHPALFGLIDSVAAAVGSPAPRVVVIDGQYNASFGHVGMRGTRVLTIGLPYFLTLDGRPRRTERNSGRGLTPSTADWIQPDLRPGTELRSSWHTRSCIRR